MDAPCTNTPHRQASSEPVAGLAALVVKDGVGIGRLTEPQRALALGLVWAGLPRGELTEKDVNADLKAQLACAASWLDTDHVELRRWLCDGGWLQRDGYGRAYQRVRAASLPADVASLGAALDGAFPEGATAAWVSEVRAAHAAARRERRQAFESRMARSAA